MLEHTLPSTFHGQNTVRFDRWYEETGRINVGGVFGKKLTSGFKSESALLPLNRSISGQEYEAFYAWLDGQGKEDWVADDIVAWLDEHGYQDGDWVAPEPPAEEEVVAPVPNLLGASTPPRKATHKRSSKTAK